MVLWCFENPPKPPTFPTKLPVIGNLHQLGLHPHRSLHSLARRHGPLMLLHLGSLPVLIASTAEAAREIMKTHDLIFPNRPRSSIPGRLLYDFKEIAFAPYGEYWRQVKSLSVLHLLSNRRVKSLRRVRVEERAAMIESTRKSCSPSLVNLSEKFISLTNDVVCSVALGKKNGGGEDGRKFKKLFAEFADLLGMFNIGDYIPWLAWINRFNGLDAKVEIVSKEFDEFLEGVVKEHTGQNKRKTNGSGKVEDGGQDFVDILLDIQNEKETGFNFHSDTIKAIILVKMPPSLSFSLSVSFHSPHITS